MKYRDKSMKSVEIEAVMFVGTISSVSDILNTNFVWLDRHPYRNRVYLNIPSSEGAMTAKVGDYIICDEGEIYLCKPHAFEQIYEKSTL
ncbi:hypothetical protein B4071_4308 [Bacillus subtilis]|nr:hypothetical protein B4071_4308 [Bacillus subtilis]